MQNDLISRSALLERINEGAIKFAVSIPSGHVETVNKLVDCFWQELKNVIEEQPTAYDVEKVVAELEERAESNRICADRLKGVEKKIRLCKWKGRAGGFETAIEIVRNGGCRR